MKLLILSDSHGSLEPMEIMVREERPQVVIHLGDFWEDAGELARQFPQIRFCRVAGNCDRNNWHPDAVTESICKFDEVTVYMTHGHLHHVKMSLLRLRLAAQEAGASIALFGHTHCPFAEEVDGLLMLNPGTCQGFSGTYGIVEIKEGTIHYEIRAFRKLLKGEYQ